MGNFFQKLFGIQQLNYKPGYASLPALFPNANLFVERTRQDKELNEYRAHEKELEEYEHRKKPGPKSSSHRLAGSYKRSHKNNNNNNNNNYNGGTRHTRRKQTRRTYKH